MVVLLYELMEEFRLKPNATIITYLLNSLSNDKSQMAMCPTEKIAMMVKEEAVDTKKFRTRDFFCLKFKDKPKLSSAVDMAL